MLNFKKNPIILGSLLLSFSGLICRGIGFFYRLFIAQAFGEEAMGIFQLTSPVLMLAFSLTCAGMQTAVSRYTASCIGKNNESLAGKSLLTGCALSFSLALLYSIIVYHQAENISIYFLHEKRCAVLLHICALSFPFSALHSCFNGYFYGKKDTRIPSFTQIIEQLVRVGSVFFLYHFFLSRNQTPTIAITCVGMVLGETISFFLSLIYYLSLCSLKNSAPPCSCISSQMHSVSGTSCNTSESFLCITKQLLALSFPLTLNRIIVNLLHSYETISIPKYLKKFGYSSNAALSIYGVMTGMALSLILFPSTFTNSVSVLLLPTVSEASSQKNYMQIKTTIYKSIVFSLFLGFGCTLFFLIFGNVLGSILFDSSLAGTFICQLSFLCPFLYLHTTLGSILNGLKKTNVTLLINIISLSIRLFFIFSFIPAHGIKGYLWGLLLSELLSSFCCLFALRKFFI